ncbi:MAG TPA: 2-oxoacid:ferredoxin oxidoreductase subunit gamma [Desulfuromonadales bacterium]|nr:2-oxoacid:ferredoxin oxidoreductase subunit gamma [Desulfuromonadales bacterium]
MRYNVFLSGYGGQGVMLAGNLLSFAAIYQGYNVTYLPSYGVEKRGGSAMCTVVYSDGDTGSPVVGHPSVAVILNQRSFDTYANNVCRGGFCIINSDLVINSESLSPSIVLVEVPMSRLANELGDSRVLNMIACGAYAQKTGLLSIDSLVAALENTLPVRNHPLIPANIKAIECGAESVRT